MPFDAIPTNKTIQKLERMYYLLDRGWCQGYLTRRYRTEFCLLGAGREVGLIQKSGKSIYLQRIQFAELLGFGGSVHELLNYNDEDTRCKEDILDLVRNTIDREREKLLA